MLQLQGVSKLGSLEFLKPKLIKINNHSFKMNGAIKNLPICILSPPDENFANLLTINDSFRHINDIAVSSVHL